MLMSWAVFDARRAFATRRVTQRHDNPASCHGFMEADQLKHSDGLLDQVRAVVVAGWTSVPGDQVGAASRNASRALRARL